MTDRTDRILIAGTGDHFGMIYDMIKFLRLFGLAVSGLFCLDPNQTAIDYDPDGLGGIFLSINGITKFLGGEPHTIICQSHKLPPSVFEAFPKAIVIYLATLEDLVKIWTGTGASIQDLLGFPYVPYLKEETGIINRANQIVVPCEATLNLFKKVYPKAVEKLYPCPLGLALSPTPQRRSQARSVDLLILCNAKANHSFLIKVLRSPKLMAYTKVAIGPGSKDFKGLPQTVSYNQSDPSFVDKYLQRAKLYLCASLYEPNPLILQKAYVSQCLTLLSPNVGFHERYESHNICQTYEIDEWVDKAIYLISNYETLKDRPIDLVHSHSLLNVLMGNSVPRSDPPELSGLIPGLHKGMKILVASTQYPSYGGAATNAYYLIERLQSAGYWASGLFINDQLDVDYNPKALPRVYLMGSAMSSLAKINQDLGGEPEYALCKNIVAPLKVHEMYPKTKIIYLVSGSIHANKLAEHELSAQRLLALPRSEVLAKVKKLLGQNEAIMTEIRCFEISDRVVFNSPLTALLYRIVYPEWISDRWSIYNTTSFAGSPLDRVSKIDRPYDLAFICSRLSRRIKNFAFFRRLMADPRLATKRILIIGEPDGQLIPTRLEVTALPLQKHEAVLQYLKEVRLLCLPSFFDSSPNILKEAIDCGCHCLLSKNVGNYDQFPKLWVCEDVYDLEEWVHKTLHLLSLSQI